MKRNVFLCLAVLLFTQMLPVYADDAAKKDEQLVLKEDFKQIIPLSVPEKELNRLKAEKFPVGRLQSVTLPKNWLLPLHNLPHDFCSDATSYSWRISGNKEIKIYTPYISELYSDFSLNAILTGGKTASAIDISIIPYDLIHNGQKQLLRTVKLNAGEKRTLHLPFRFDFVNPGIRIELKIIGDVLMQDFSVTGIHTDITQNGFSCVEGTLEACSAIPSPQKSAYPDCRFTCHFKGKSICSGVPCPNNIQLVVDGFRNYRLLNTRKMKVGDKIRCVILPFDKIPDKMKSIQQADDLELFLLNSYYAVKIEQINSFSYNNIIPFNDVTEPYISVFERKVNPPLSKDLDDLQQTAIAKDLEKINTLLAGWDEAKIQRTNESFQKAWDTEKAKDKPGYNRVKIKNKTYVWRNIDNSFWTLPEKYQLISAYQPIMPHNINALVALRDFLHTNGCQFMITVVPDLFDISSRVINPEFRTVPDFYTAMTVQELLKNGIEAIYASDAIIKNYNQYPLAFFYPAADEHPFDTSHDVLSDLTAIRLTRFKFAANRAAQHFTIAEYPHVYKNLDGYFFPASCDIGKNQDNTPYPCHCVDYDSKAISSDSSSPVLIVGNSFMRFPMNAPDAFPAFLSYKSKMGIASYRVEGYGPMLAMIQHFFADPVRFLKNKKIVILYVGVRHLHARIKFNDIRTMDQASLLMDGKSFQTFIPVEGNDKKTPDFAKGLFNPHIFTVPADKECSVKDFEIPDCNIRKEILLVIPVCINSLNKATLLVNGNIVPTEECLFQFYWCKTVVRVPPGEKHIKIELKGTPATSVAVGDIQLYQ